MSHKEITDEEAEASRKKTFKEVDVGSIISFNGQNYGFRSMNVRGLVVQKQRSPKRLIVIPLTFDNCLYLATFDTDKVIQKMINYPDMHGGVMKPEE
jgi:uncharacterized pyridoxamine 5'-phosphate oxidase family protein